MKVPLRAPHTHCHPYLTHSIAFFFPLESSPRPIVRISQLNRNWMPRGGGPGGVERAWAQRFVSLSHNVCPLLAALGRSREATQDMCAYGFLERCIERFFTLTHHPEVDLKSWGEIALFIARLSRGGKNVKGYGSVNDVLMRCNVAPKLYQMAIPDHGQHYSVATHCALGPQVVPVSPHPPAFPCNLSFYPVVGPGGQKTWRLDDL